VRELENVVQRALILSGSDVIDAETLPLQATPGSPTFALPLPVAVPPAPTFAHTANVSVAEQVIGEKAISANSPSAPANMKDPERQHILDTLANVGGSRKKAVALLGISERTLRYKLAQYRDEGFIADEDVE
jgi:two-component system response regulator FlrC